MPLPGQGPSAITTWQWVGHGHGYHLLFLASNCLDLGVLCQKIDKRKKICGICKFLKNSKNHACLSFSFSVKESSEEYLLLRVPSEVKGT